MADIPFDFSGKRIWITGHRGMIGSALLRRLAGEGCKILIIGREDLDLRDQAATEAWMAANKPQAVFLAAATVGGIQANNSRPAEFLFDNLAIETNVIHGAWKTGVEKLMFLGSNCIYPREAAQPIREDSLLTGPLEPTNQWYAVAKIAGLKMCQAYRRQYGCDFITVQPTSAYGPGDNFDPASSHVISALMKKAHEAKANGDERMDVWGTGKPLREYIFVDDLADALVFLMKVYSSEEHINVGTGEEVSICDLARQITKTVGYAGKLEFDAAKPDGMPRKLLDSTRLKELGWSADTPLEDGLVRMYAWYVENQALTRKRQ